LSPSEKAGLSQVPDRNLAQARFFCPLNERSVASQIVADFPASWVASFASLAAVGSTLAHAAAAAEVKASDPKGL
jgi:hypothetical protein